MHLAAYRQVAVEQAPPASVHLVVLAHWVVVALARRAELVPLQPVARSAAAAVAVVQAVAAAEQTRSMR